MLNTFLYCMHGSLTLFTHVSLPPQHPLNVLKFSSQTLLLLSFIFIVFVIGNFSSVEKRSNQKRSLNQLSTDFEKFGNEFHNDIKYAKYNRNVIDQYYFDVPLS